jgi:hypothetical protein
MQLIAKIVGRRLAGGDLSCLTADAGFGPQVFALFVLRLSFSARGSNAPAAPSPKADTAAQVTENGGSAVLCPCPTVLTKPVLSSFRLPR